VVVYTKADFLADMEVKFDEKVQGFPHSTLAGILHSHHAIVESVTVNALKDLTVTPLRDEMGRIAELV